MKTKPMDETLREWLADRMSDFSHALKAGEDPEVTFEFQTKGMPKVICQVRLMDCPTVYTREEILVDVAHQ